MPLLIEQSEVVQRLAVLGQMADLLCNTQLTSARGGGGGGGGGGINRSLHSCHGDILSAGRPSYVFPHGVGNGTRGCEVSRPHTQAGPSVRPMSGFSNGSGHGTNNASAHTAHHPHPIPHDRRVAVPRASFAVTTAASIGGGGGEGVLSRFILTRARQASANNDDADGEDGGSERASGSNSIIIANGASSGGDGVEFLFSAGLQLPRSCGPDVATALAELGRALRSACGDLTAAVEAELVSFYDHMKKKEMPELTALLAGGGGGQRSVRPPEFEGRVATATAASAAISAATDVDGHGGGGGASHPGYDDDSDGDGDGDEADVLSVLGDDDDDDHRHQHYNSASVPFLPPAGGRKQQQQQRRQPPAAAIGARPTVPRNAATVGRPRSVASGGGGALLASLPPGGLTKQLTESRAAASTLQSFLHLLLETALTQCEATCGAVYLNDPAPQPQLAASLPESRAAATAGAGGGNAPLRFLRSVARINTTGHLPYAVSNAITSTLTTIISTGVALNLRNTVYSVDGEEERGAAATTAGGPTVLRHGHSSTHGSRYMNVSNCVAVPIKDYGVVVLANKRHSSTNHNDGRGGAADSAAAAVVMAATSTAEFNAGDEHVAWGVAVLLEGLISRYRRELLTSQAWSPVGIAQLSRFSLLAPVGCMSANADAVERASTRRSLARSGGGGKSASPTFRRAGADTKGTAGGGGGGGLLPGGGFGGHAGGILSFIAAQEYEHPTARSLIVVRTADARTVAAVPREAIPRRNPGGHGGGGGGFHANTTATAPTATTSSTATTAVATIGDEDLFEGAALYIVNLESLWRQALTRHNVLQGTVDRSEAEIAKRQERVSGLETRVRKLNARVIQLERNSDETASSPFRGGRGVAGASPANTSAAAAAGVARSFGAAGSPPSNGDSDTRAAPAALSVGRKR